MSGDVIGELLAWRASGRGVALATVVKTWGSSPRPAGSQLAINDAGAFAGSVSGGCVEGAVVQAAARVIASGEAEMLSFGVTNAEAWEVGLACGGSVNVFVHGVDDAQATVLGALHADRKAKRGVVLLTDLESGALRLVSDAGDVDDVLREAASEALRNDRARKLEHQGRTLFVQPHCRPLRMVIVGAVHIAQSLASVATMDGFDVTVVDPRSAFATPERFPSVTLSTAWPDKALAELRPDRRTAVVTLTHDPKLDEPALVAALASEAFYIAALGSRKTHAARLARLRARGIDDAALERIHGPAGLNIGARSTAEIALSIMAECIRVLRA